MPTKKKTSAASTEISFAPSVKVKLGNKTVVLRRGPGKRTLTTEQIRQLVMGVPAK